MKVPELEKVRRSLLRADDIIMLINKKGVNDNTALSLLQVSTILNAAADSILRVNHRE